MTVAHRNPTDRENRGRQAARERFEDFGKIRPFTWVVPSCSADHAYLVHTKNKTCSCPDAIWRDPGADPCKHVYAARIVARQTTTTCEGCGERLPLREMVECVDGGGSFANHDNIRYFDGDHVCFPCADRDGVTR